MKLVAAAWMDMSDGTKGFEGYEIVEHKREIDKFKLEHSDDTFDISFTFHLIPNETDYEKFEYDPLALELLVSDTPEREITEETALLMLSTSKVL